VFPQLSSNKNATLPTLVRGIMLFSSGCSI